MYVTVLEATIGRRRAKWSFWRVDKQIRFKMEVKEPEREELEYSIIKERLVVGSVGARRLRPCLTLYSLLS